MSTRSKGNQFEREAEKLLEGWDYRTWRAKAVRRGFQKDILGLFDIIATDECDIILIQVKADYADASKARKAIKEFPLPYHKVPCVVLMRERGKKDRFRYWLLKDGNWKTRGVFDATTDPREIWRLNDDPGGTVEVY